MAVRTGEDLRARSAKNEASEAPVPLPLPGVRLATALGALAREVAGLLLVLLRAHPDLDVHVGSSRSGTARVASFGRKSVPAADLARKQALDPRLHRERELVLRDRAQGGLLRVGEVAFLERADHPEAHEAVVGILDALDELVRRLRRELRVDDVDHVALDVAESGERLLQLRADLRRAAADPVLHVL